MLNQSFVLLPNVGVKKEQLIWMQEITSWDDFLSASKIKGVSSKSKAKYDQLLKTAHKHLVNEQSWFFAETIPRVHHWRVYDEFKYNAVFLDIETSGYYGDISVIGLSDGLETKTIVKGINLNKSLLVKELSKYSLILTFNGSSFDIPVVKRFFSWFPKIPHIDLRSVCTRLGFTGGLKSIEQQLGIKRNNEVVSLSGEDAVYLWQMWRSSGDRDFLDRLVAYNEEDVLNLKPIAEKLISVLWNGARYGSTVLQRKSQVFQSQIEQIV